MFGLIQDIRFGIRQFIKKPLWTLSIVLVLGIGAGANTAMFSGFEAWVLRPLDFPDPERVVAVRETEPKLGRFDVSVSSKNYGDWVAQQQSFEGLGAYRRSKFNLSDDYEPVRLDGARITASVFPTLGKHPVLGRGFTEEDDRPGQPAPVALISDNLWRTRFEADANIIGRTVRLDGRVHEVIGVMEPGFKFPEWAEVWTPFGLDVMNDHRGNRRLGVVARLRQDTTLESARQDMNAIAKRLEKLYPETNRDHGIGVVNLRDDYMPTSVRVALWTSLGASIFVLLVICANVASLMLAQATARSRETAVRTALGAGRFRLIRQNLIEGILLALPAGALGIVLGTFSVQSMLNYVPVDPPYLFTMGFSAGAGVYTLVVSILAGMICGLAPVIRTSGLHLMEALKSGGERTAGAGSGKRLRGALVMGEIALSTSLLIAALLMVKSFLLLQNVDRGYRTDGVLTADLSLSGEGLDDAQQRVVQVESIVNALASLPNVDGVGISSQLPSSPSNRVWGLVAQGRPFEPGEHVEAMTHAVAGEYLDTLEIPLLAGRAFTATEKRRGGKVALVSKGLANRLWGEESPLGRRVKLPSASEDDWLTVVGVVGDVDYGRDMTVVTLPDVQLYLPYGELATSYVSIVIGSSSPPTVVAPAMRQALRASAPGVPISEILTMDDAIFRVRWVSRFFGRQLAGYAVLATLIAALGLYGLTADSVSRRSRELAIRIALGAKRGDLIRMVVRETLLLGGLGIAVGVLMALGLTRFTSGMLVMVSTRDPAVFAAVTALLLAVTLVAGFLPARRASAMDANSALRTE
jgi:predicted permease